MLSLTADKADLTWACQPSQDLSGSLTATGGRPEARLEKAAKHLLAACVRVGELKLNQVTSDGFINQRELVDLGSWGWNLWKHVQADFPDPNIGEPLEATHVTDAATWLLVGGTVDVYSIVGDEARILSWQFGRRIPPLQHNLMAQAFLVASKHLQVKRVVIKVALVRDQEVVGLAKPGYWLREQLEEWANEMSRRLEAKAGEYQPGPHCSQCRRQADCPARTAVLRAAYQGLLDLESQGLSSGLALPLDPAKEGDFYVSLYLLAERARAKADVVLEMVRQHVEGQPGEKVLDTKGHTLGLWNQLPERLSYAALKPALDGLVSVDSRFEDAVFLDREKVHQAALLLAAKSRSSRNLSERSTVIREAINREIVNMQQKKLVFQQADVADVEVPF